MILFIYFDLVANTIILAGPSGSGKTTLSTRYDNYSFLLGIS